MTHVAIIGGGFAGMAAAEQLGEKGVPCSLFEAESTLGGLGGCVQVAGQPIERYYHHIKPQDTFLLEKIKSSGLSPDLVWEKSEMAFYFNGRLYPFSRPVDLLHYTPFNLIDKLQFIIGMLRVRLGENKRLENLNAEQWAIKNWNPTIYHSMMKPLLMNKFGISPEQVSAAFFHGRIKNLLEAKSNTGGKTQFGYLLNSLDPFIEQYKSELSANCTISTSTPLERINKIDNGYRIVTGNGQIDATWVINTMPLPLFEAIPKNFQFTSDIEYQVSICAIFAIDETLDIPYWTNILDKNINCRLMVNQSKLADYPCSMIYCANYVRQDDPLMAMSDEDICKLYQKDIEAIAGKFTCRDVNISRTRYATPVFDIGFPKKMARLRDHMESMIFSGMVDIYPGDRTISSIMSSGYRAADTIITALD